MKKLNLEKLKAFTQNYVPNELAGGTDETPNASKETVLSLPLASIEPDPAQPRTTFDETELDELAASIRRYGLLQPIVVREKEGEPGHYIIVTGERRWRASQRLEGPNIRALLLPALPHVDLGYIQMIENLQRSNLTVEEVSTFISRMIADGATQQEVADRLGLRRDRVAMFAQWNRFPDCVRTAVQEGRIAAIRTACELRTLYEKHPEEVEAFLSELGEISTADVRRFAKSIGDNDNPREPKSTKFPMDASETEDEVPNELTSSESESASNPPALDLDIEDDADESEFEVELQETSDNSRDSDVLREEESKAEEEGIAFVFGEKSEIGAATASPVVLCHVEGRSCRLLWRIAAKCHVWVRWEDNDIDEELPVETVQLLGVQCGEVL